MKKLNFIGWLLLLAIAIGSMWYYFFPSPERQVENDLKKLSAAISADVSSSMIRKAANANRIVSFFTTDAVIHTQGFSKLVESLTGHDEIMQAVLAARSTEGGLNVEFYNIRVEVATGHETAAASLTAIVKLTPQSEPMTADLRVAFKKIDRDWLITSVDPLPH